MVHILLGCGWVVLFASGFVAGYVSVCDWRGSRHFHRALLRVVPGRKQKYILHHFMTIVITQSSLACTISWYTTHHFPFLLSHKFLNATDINFVTSYMRRMKYSWSGILGVIIMYAVEKWMFARLQVSYCCCQVSRHQRRLLVSF